MQLKRLSLYNFMPYHKEHEISFPTDLPSRNVMLIFGDNMRGKTSFLNAIRWGFFGNAIGRHLKRIDRVNLVNRDAAKSGDWETRIRIEFLSEGDEYDLRRVMKPKHLVAIPQSNDDFEIELSLSKNNRALSYEEAIYEINQIIPEQISRFFLFDGELLQEYEMLLIEGSDQGAKIKEAIEQVLGVPALINGRNQIRSLLKKARNLQRREASHKEALKAQVAEMQQLEVDAERYEADLKKLKEKYETLEAEIDELEESLRASEGAIRFQDDLDRQKKDLGELQKKEEALRTERLGLLSDAWRDLLQPRLQIEIEFLEKEVEQFTAGISQTAVLQSQLTDLKAIFDKGTCPTCERDVSESERKSIAKKLSQIETDLERSEDNSAQLSLAAGRLDSLRKVTATGSVNRIQSIESELETISVNMVSIESDIASIEEKIKGFDSAKAILERERLETKIENRGILKDDIKKVEGQIDENDRQQTRLSKLLVGDPDAEKTPGTVQVEVLSELDEIFDEGIGMLRDDLRESVADRATKTFRKLTTETSYKGLDINSSYGLSIIGPDGSPIAERSAGAEQIVALALIDGLNKTARKTGPIVMDTPLARLDPNHRNNILTYLPEMADQVILLVHEGELQKSMLDKTLKDRVGVICDIERVSATKSKLNLN